MQNGFSGTLQNLFDNVGGSYNGQPVYGKYNIVLDDGTTLSNDDLYQDSVTWTQSIGDGDDIVPGGCVASTFSFEVSTKLNLKKQWITVSFSCVDANDTVMTDENGNPATVGIGRFKVLDSEKSDDIDEYRKCTAYDMLYARANKKAKKWITQRKYNVHTLKEQRESLLEFFGVEYESQTLDNDNLTCVVTTADSDTTCVELLKKIMALSGAYGRMSRSGKFEAITLTKDAINMWTAYSNPQSMTVPSVYSAHFQDDVVPVVTGVEVFGSSSDTGVIYGTEDNVMTMSDNVFLYFLNPKKDEDEVILSRYAEGILHSNNEIEYYPGEVQVYGNPIADAGDYIRVIRTLDSGLSESHELIIMSRTMEGIAGLTDTYTSSGNAERSDATTSTSDTAKKAANRSAAVDVGAFDEKYAPKDSPVFVNNMSMGRKDNTKVGNSSTAFGVNVTASGVGSHAEGNATTASGFGSHAEGNRTTASGDCPHAEGNETTASGLYPHAEGNATTASGFGSHAEGNITTASGDCSHAEGNNTTASGRVSHAEGMLTEASNHYSHAEGHSTQAYGYCSHSEGLGNIAQGGHQHVSGTYNIVDTSGTHLVGTVDHAGTYAEIVGNGQNESSRSNARTLDWEGNAWHSGDVTATDKTTGIEYSLIETAKKAPSEFPVTSVDGETGDIDLTSKYVSKAKANAVSGDIVEADVTIDSGTAEFKFTIPPGEKGDPGEKGEQGTGMSSFIEEYYLSTSKTEQTGGSWTTTPPTWSSGMYVWTRFKITYTNPSSTVYTVPVCDSSWNTVAETVAIIVEDGSTASNLTITDIGISAITNQITFKSSDGLRTIISGGKIESDALKSNNYEDGVSGSFLDLSDGTFKSKYLNWDSTGKMTVTGGIVGGFNVRENNLICSAADNNARIGFSNSTYYTYMNQKGFHTDIKGHVLDITYDGMKLSDSGGNMSTFSHDTVVRTLTASGDVTATDKTTGIEYSLIETAKKASEITYVEELDDIVFQDKVSIRGWYSRTGSHVTVRLSLHFNEDHTAGEYIELGDIPKLPAMDLDYNFGNSGFSVPVFTYKFDSDGSVKHNQLSLDCSMGVFHAGLSINYDIRAEDNERNDYIQFDYITSDYTDPYAEALDEINGEVV